MPILLIRIRWPHSVERVRISSAQLARATTRLRTEETWIDEEVSIEYSATAKISVLPNGQRRIDIEYSPAENRHITPDMEINWGASVITLSKDLRRAKAIWINNPLEPDYCGPAIRCEVLDESAASERDIETVKRLKRRQARFKRLLVQEVGFRCELTGKADDVLLEAAHIVSASKSESDEPENGLLLRLDLHRLYDRGYFTISPAGIVKPTELSRELSDHYQNLLPTLRLGLGSLTRVGRSLSARKA